MQINLHNGILGGFTERKCRHTRSQSFPNFQSDEKWRTGKVKKAGAKRPILAEKTTHIQSKTATYTLRIRGKLAFNEPNLSESRKAIPWPSIFTAFEDPTVGTESGQSDHPPTKFRHVPVPTPLPDS